MVVPSAWAATWKGKERKGKEICMICLTTRVG